MSILALDNVSVRLPPKADRPFALENVSLQLNENEILCVVGESGSGKSMTANAIMRLLPPGVAVSQGTISFADRDLVAMDEVSLRKVRGAEIAMIFQEPMTALNPLRTIGDQIGEMYRTHTNLGRSDIDAKVLTLLGEVGIPEPTSAIRAYPHELSGGQRQRAMIAMALALGPRVLIADEPTTALDVTTQARILKLIKDLQRDKGTAVLFITHDFGVVAEIADRVVVMQNGRVVEQGTVAQVLQNPQHPYTRQLLAAVPPLQAPPPRMLASKTILAASGLTKTYRKSGLFGRGKRETHALDNVSITLPRGATLGVVGESGSGKTTLARCIIRLIDPDAGSIDIEGIDFAHLSRSELRRASDRVQMVFQDPFGSLNPRRRAGELVAQGPIAHGTSRREAWERARELFALVGLDPEATERYPHEFSGGQRQRIGLARALALKPKLLIADEPVSALDVSVQAQVLKLLKKLQTDLDLSILFITHDLRVAAQVSDHIAVMKDGIVVETGRAADVFTNPKHDYTKALLASIPGRNLHQTASQAVPPQS
ncbi:glutathione import ATP-binding protein GsiA [Variibacter gotjawalensis]|uniref:Glutathione import ATP-binding protein GsiA n=1 Tax=Variibacter gotjawalensis TaxID=1333996 RepID=A0A0S3PZ88_9BRAD|nr:ABC transporter ATP-binding protein [Variibacter gotjawalensis]NIK47035.1 peptide/nickel transport system ATP-binding protein [Variibacter gotjawalensis]RZS48940.1 peptide/nickel transport system ATP-binding protein [Variibacter gotjawalensis]BAT61198.1 glutathione import ATP-binding protein GsiA [Variibacter gotjawalensis]